MSERARHRDTGSPGHYAGRMSLVAMLCVALIGLCGCEGLQRKFTRQRKHPSARPDPILAFQDYTKAMTPSEKYRKHSLMFDYWNGRLLETLDERPISTKRVQRDSGEALGELTMLHGLLANLCGLPTFVIWCYRHSNERDWPGEER